MNFYVGQRVVCIKPSEEHGLFKNKIYTISDRYCCSVCGDIHVSYGVLGGEIDCICCRGTKESGYWYAYESRFLPLSERTTESEVFAENLITQLETEVETLEWLHK